MERCPVGSVGRCGRVIERKRRRHGAPSQLAIQPSESIPEQVLSPGLPAISERSSGELASRAQVPRPVLVMHRERLDRLEPGRLTRPAGLDESLPRLGGFRESSRSSKAARQPAERLGLDVPVVTALGSSPDEAARRHRGHVLDPGGTREALQGLVASPRPLVDPAEAQADAWRIGDIRSVSNQPDRP